MPATEQTWRNQTKMHVIFAVSGVIMLVATVWMMAADHLREWKDWQLADRKKDAWMLQARHDELADQYSRTMSKYDADIRRLDGQEIEDGVIGKFKDAVRNENARLAKGGASEGGEEEDQTTQAEKPAVNVAQVAAVNETPAEDESQFARLDARVAELKQAVAELQKLQTPSAEAPAQQVDAAAIKAAEDKAIAARRNVLAEMDKYVREARRRENRLVGQKKIANGIRTAVVSELGIKVGEGASDEEIAEVQARIDKLNAQLADLTAGIAAAKDYRMALEGAVDDADAEKAALVKNRGAMETELARLDDQVYKNTTHIGEWVTRWPVLNALYNGNIRIEQNWLPDLTINYNFSQAARFDRCTTCHRAISTTAPGSPTDPLYPTLHGKQREFALEVATPAEQPAAGTTIREAYGIELSPTGIINEGDVTVRYALPESPAARAGIQSGDVLLAVGDAPVHSPGAAAEQLLKFVKWGSTVSVSIRRGLDHPFTAHPRLDLYLTDTSPHPQKVVGCTICHDGQGSGTSFKWTSHTPDNSQQEDEWMHKYGWFDNHHWIFPMRPARFVESNCLKCHHQKGALEPTERFPDPPAPKLVEGWTLVETYGCFGCHEINGFDSPTKTVGPDLRLEPTYHEVAAEMLRDKGLNEEERGWAQTLIEHPENVESRNQLFAAVKKDSALTADAKLSDETHRLANALKDVETPGQYRKVGPSLRFLASKVDYDWIYAWIRKPTDFRPTTRMPQFFGQYEHLTEPEDKAELAESERFEPIEIRALAEYLLRASDKFEYLTPPKEVTEQASAERGKWLFQTRGCLACHSHDDFPGIASPQGPNLSRVAAKFNNEKGRKWIYSWVKQPNRYHVRTKMPQLFLDPIAEKDAQGKPTGKVTDPAADIVAFLLGVPSDWKPANVPPRKEWTDAEKKSLLDLSVVWLKSDTIPEGRARKYLEEGVPPEQASKLKPDDRMLVGITDDNRTDRQLEFLARHTVGKYGCFGCHDIPGFEDAKTIGTGLVDWGRKEPSKLAFENIHRFLEVHGIHPPNPGEAPKGPTAPAAQTAGAIAPPPGQAGEMVMNEPGAPPAEAELDPGKFSPDESYFISAINSHSRDGFLWQKLRYPRSFDYKTTRNKNFNERLRMPRFPFTDEQREAIETFVLGLVKEPPAEKYIFRPDAREQAIIEGRQVLDRFHCYGCHTLKMEQWELPYAKDTFDAPPETTDYPFLAPQFTEKEIAASMAKDYRGLMHASLHGMPVMDEQSGAAGWVDQDRQPITAQDLKDAEAESGKPVPVFYKFTLWRDALLNGLAHPMGLEELLVPAARDHYGPVGGAAWPAWGGDLARYLFPKVIAHAKQSNPQVNGREAWSWLPPPLMAEGRKVQPDWLHDFLMDPTSIRPAVVMRMPNFHMSSAEASKLVNYFAAASGAEFPYDYKRQQRASYLAERRTERKDPLGEAMHIVTNGNYCVKCHSVADFTPQGEPTSLGPNLADVYRRLRPDYVRNWVANPVRILPYTGMPVNIPYHPNEDHMGGVSQNLYHGTSIEQLTGVVDLLMNFDAYARGQTSVAPLVQQATASQPAADAQKPSGEGEKPPQ